MAGVKVVEEENVPETVAVQKTMKGMITQDGANAAVPDLVRLLRPAHAGHGRQVPEVRFAHCGGMWTEGKHPKNAGSYFGYIDECQYLNGVDRRPHEQERQDRLRRRQADPAGAAQHQRLHDGRALGQPGITMQRDLHRRLVDGRSRRPRPPTAWPTRAATSSPCTSTARRWWSRPRPSAARWSAATTPARPSWRPRPT